MGPCRSFLFAPGNHPRRVEKALALDADVVILDLEDAVPISEKVATRAVVADALGAPRKVRGYVRVNGWDSELCLGDLSATVGPNLDGIVFPKVESAAQLQAIDWLLAQFEQERGLPVGGIDLIPIIETGLGHANIRDIATAGTRCRRLTFGAADYTLDMDMTWTLEEDELTDIRQAVVLASRVGGLEPPIDTVFVHIRDNDGLCHSAKRGRSLGFQGKLCIHPDQISSVHAAFTPTADAVAKAKRIVAAFKDAEAAGSASIQVDGYFVDYPVVEQARRTVALMEHINRHGRR